MDDSKQAELTSAGITIAAHHDATERGTINTSLTIIGAIAAAGMIGGSVHDTSEASKHIDYNSALAGLAVGTGIAAAGAIYQGRRRPSLKSLTREMELHHITPPDGEERKYYQDKFGNRYTPPSEKNKSWTIELAKRANADEMVAER